MVYRLLYDVRSNEIFDVIDYVDDGSLVNGNEVVKIEGRKLNGKKKKKFNIDKYYITEIDRFTEEDFKFKNDKMFAHFRRVKDLNDWEQNYFLIKISFKEGSKTFGKMADSERTPEL